MSTTAKTVLRKHVAESTRRTPNSGACALCLYDSNGYEFSAAEKRIATGVLAHCNGKQMLIFHSEGYPAAKSNKLIKGNLTSPTVLAIVSRAAKGYWKLWPPKNIYDRPFLWPLCAPAQTLSNEKLHVVKKARPLWLALFALFWSSKLTKSSHTLRYMIWG